MYSGIILVGGTPEIVSYVTVVEYILACVAVILVGLLAIRHLSRRDDFFYGATILWALGGILFLQATSPTPPIYFILCTAAAMIAVILAMIIGPGRRRDQTRE